MRSAIASVALLFVVACGTEDTGMMMMEEPPDDGILDGFEVVPPGAGEEQFITPILQEFAPEEDTTLCTYLDFTVAEDSDIIHVKGYQSAQGHHAILYGANMKMPPGTHVCNEADMYNTHYLGGAGGADGGIAFDLPEGLAFRVHADTQIMIQTHWINFSDQPVRGQAAFNVTRQPPSAEVVPADLFSDVNTNFSLPVGVGTAQSICTVGEDMQYFLLGGHAHEHGTHITISIQRNDGDPPEIVDDEEWGPEKVFDPNLLWYTKEDPLTLHAGDSMIIDCTYNNTAGEAIYFPSEMCVAFGYYFPAERQLNCVNNSWPGL